ncbi:MAG: hypothetical protein R3F31_14330 [Verrucomicrobiales bacterium]
MTAETPFSRRRALKTLFCSSAALALNVRREAKAQVEIPPESLQLFAIGDYGTGGGRPASCRGGHEGVCGEKMPSGPTAC